MFPRFVLGTMHVVSHANMPVVYYSRQWTKRLLDHFQHVHFFKMADISDAQCWNLNCNKKPSCCRGWPTAP